MSDVIQLKGGFTATDPRLGRVPERDPRNFLVRGIMAPEQFTIISKTWWLPPHFVHKKFDQNGSQCTGMSRAYDLAMSPVPLKRKDGLPFTEADAQEIYDWARKFDQWAGEDYEGSSVLGAAKACIYLGYIGEYRFADSIDDYLGALGHIGPIINGTDWTNTMFEAHPSGLIIPSDVSDMAGGHAYVTRSIYTNRDYIRRKLGRGEPIRNGVPLLSGPNSWGNGWARDGDWLMWSDDMERLLKGLDRWPGDACITTQAFSRPQRA